MPDHQPHPSRDAHRAWVLSALEQYEQRLVRFAVRLVRDEEAARDVVQHAFMQLCRQSADKREELETDEAVGRWLFSVVRCRTIDLFRKQQREPTVNGEPAVEMLADAASPARMLEQKELGKMLLALVDLLPPAQRESVLLWADGWTAKEIGGITERAPATVRVHLHKAFAALRDHPKVRRLRDGVEETIDR